MRVDDGDAVTGTDNAGGGDKVRSGTRSQVIDAHIDGAEARKAFHLLFQAAGSDALGDAQKRHESRGHIQSRRYHATVQDVARVIADQLVAHAEAHARMRVGQLLDFQAEQLIERNFGEEIVYDAVNVAVIRLRHGRYRCTATSW